jgi:hypothetical protein
MIRITAVYLVVVWICICSCYNSKQASVNTADTGKQFVYSYSSDGIGYSDIQMLYNTDSSIKMQPFFYRPSLQTMRVNIQCKVRKTITGYAGKTVHVCFEIMEPVVKIENNGLPVDVEMIRKEMSVPVFADLSAAGNILTVRRDTTVSYLTAGIVKNVLSNTQMVMPAGDAVNWQVTEENTMGFFKANYQLIKKNADSIEHQKTNMGYEKIPTARNGQRLFPDSKATIVTDTSGIVQRISASESLVTLFGSDTIVASGSSMEYNLLSTDTLQQEGLLAFEELEQSGRYLKPVALSDPISDEEITRLAYKNTLADDNFETLVEKLGQVGAHDEQYESELTKKFRALAWLRENDCSKMATMLKEAALGSVTFRIMSHALAAVETPFSIDELAAVVSARRSDELVMMELLPVLATSTTPTGKAADIIKELAFSNAGNAVITTTAQLTLGGMIKNLRIKDRKKADELTEVVVENMKNSRDTLQQLLVYGNTGSYQLLPVLSSYIRNPAVSAEVQKAAVFALRLIDHRDVTSILENLVSGKDTVLSKAATETISFRKEYLHTKP